ncbi:unnamed protein product [Caenorhabditis bovis]|uniref:Caspase n=1 Tax=Caenorhabditis bovis TaxID=2654633 RepID=A0A8S1F2Z5_9PELO|nr:unnamed protein product [Caenorhabditis bovis]
MMRAERRALLDSNLLSFSKLMKTDAVMDLLVAKKIFNDTVVDNVYSGRTERERRKEVIRAVQRRGDAAYEALYNALNESGQHELAELMKPLVNEALLSSTTTIDDVEMPTLRRNTISPRGSHRISNYSISMDSYDESESHIHEITTRSPRLRHRDLSAVFTGGRVSRPSRSTSMVDTYDVEMIPIQPPSPHRHRRATSPTYSPSRRRIQTARETVPLTPQSYQMSFQEALNRARSRSRPRALQDTDRLNYQACNYFTRGEPKLPAESPTRNYCSVYNLRSSLGRKVQDMHYVFQEESMNYVDAPFIERIFDRETMYPNFTNPRGLCLIINNEHFEQMPSRNGTKTDKENISNLFRCMGYTIVTRDNLSARELLQEVHNFAKDPMHRRCSSAIIVILSHGEENQIIGVDDQTVSTHDLLDLLSASKAPNLANKPKLIFVQACRGERRDTGFPVIDSTDGIPALLRRNAYDKGDGPLFNFLGCVRPQAQPTYRKKPEQADILVAYATTAQYVSWRNSVRGSWFIQAICEVFAQHARNMDIIEMLTEVNKKVACGFQTSQGSTTLKQMPELTSRLVKKFYFWPCRASSV